MYFFSTAILLFLLHAIPIQTSADTQCPYVPAIPQDTRQNTTRLRLVQYNVEWLFIDYYASADCPGQGCTWHNASEAETHMTYVAKTIHTLNPDILHLCEVEGCDELSLLSETLSLVEAIAEGKAVAVAKAVAKAEGKAEAKAEAKATTTQSTYRPYLIKGTDTSTGQNVGILTRIDPTTNLTRTEERYTYPIPGSKCGYTGAPSTTGVSKHQITTYNLHGRRKIAMIGAHLLAIPTDPTRCAEREAQATILRDVIANYTSQHYEIIMIGDFNDYDAEIPDVNNNQPISTVLDILKGNGDLVSVALNIPKQERYSDWWDPNEDCISSQNEFSMIDHILVSKSLSAHIEQAFVYHGYDEYCGKYNSDHYPLVVDFIGL